MPGNIFGLQASPHDDGTIGLSFNVLQLIVIAVAIGIAALKVGEPAEPFLASSASALAIVQKVLWWVILLAPIGTVGLIGNAVATTAGSPSARSASSPVPSTSASPWCCSSSTRCCCALHGLSPLRYFAGAWPAIQLAFVSRSSIGTLPVTERVTEQNLGVPRSYASFAVPLGRDDEDGRLRGDLPGAGGDLRGPVLRRAPVDHRLPADRRWSRSSARRPPPASPAPSSC